MIILPSVSEASNASPISSPQSPVEDFNSHTYEDILATAVLTKVTEAQGDPLPQCVVAGAEVNHGQTSTDTDSGVSGSTRELAGKERSRSHNTCKRRILTSLEDPGTSSASPERSSSFESFATRVRTSPDMGVGTENIDLGDYWGEQGPWQFKIEEHLEEVVTHHLTEEGQSDDSDEVAWNSLDGLPRSKSSGTPAKWRKRRRTRRSEERETRRRDSLSSATVLPRLEVAFPSAAELSPTKVAFPELGANLLSESAIDCVEIHPGDVIIGAGSWQENWLFQRQKRVPDVSSSRDVVQMLIPSPMQVVPATVGDRDVDELSDLSDFLSSGVCDSWSSDSEEFQGFATSVHDSTSLSLSHFGESNAEYTETYNSVGNLRLSRGACSSSPEERHGDLANGETPSSSSSLDGRRCAGEPPVPKPRRLSLRDGALRRIQGGLHHQSLPTTDRKGAEALLIEPSHVPSDSRYIQSSSESIWFVAHLEDTVVQERRTLRLTCQFASRGPVGLTWYHEGAPMCPGPNWAHFQRNGELFFYVFQSTASRGGRYALAARTCRHCVWSFCCVTVAGFSKARKPLRFLKPLGDAVFEEEVDDLVIQCQVSGHPEPKVIFRKNSLIIEASPRVYIENDIYGSWVLTIARCRQSDSGLYSATASNGLEYLETTCVVTVAKEFPRKEAEDPGRSSQANDEGADGFQATQDSAGPGWAFSSFESPEQGSLEGALDIPSALPGTIAEREHRKWKEAVPLSKNPYDPELLARRLSQRSLNSGVASKHLSPSSRSAQRDVRAGMMSKVDLHRYARDYYVHGASRQNEGDSDVPSLRISSLSQRQPCSPSDSPDENEQSRDLAKEGQQSGGIFSLGSLAWKEELKDIQDSRVVREVARLQRGINAQQREWEEKLLQLRSAGREVAGGRSLIFSSSEVVNAQQKISSAERPRLWRTVSVDILGRNSNYNDGCDLLSFPRRTSLDYLGEGRQSKSDHGRESVLFADLSAVPSRRGGDPPSSALCEPCNAVEDACGKSYTRSSFGSLSDLLEMNKEKGLIELPSVKDLVSRYEILADRQDNKASVSSAFGNQRRPFVDSFFASHGRDEDQNRPSKLESKKKIEVFSLTARSVPRCFREGLKKHSQRLTNNNVLLSMPPPRIASILSEDGSLQYSSLPTRDAPSPECLGIPYGAPFIPSKPPLSSGETSDDSTAGYSFRKKGHERTDVLLRGDPKTHNCSSA